MATERISKQKLQQMKQQYDASDSLAEKAHILKELGEAVEAAQNDVSDS